MKMLEVGCGTNFFWSKMADSDLTYDGWHEDVCLKKQGLDLEEIKKKIRLYAVVDRSTDIAKSCREYNKKAKKAGLSDIRFVACKACGTKLPFYRKMFDFVVLGDVLSLPEKDVCDCPGNTECALTDDGKCKELNCSCSRWYCGLPWKMKKAIIYESFRVLKVGGYLFVVTNQTPGFAIRSYQLFDTLRRKEILTVRFSGWNYFLGLQKTTPEYKMSEIKTERLIPRLPTRFYNEPAIFYA